MFDLEARIREWRRALTGRLEKEPVDELESHLREEMHRAALAGRPLESAWNDAVARLGSADGLADEFAKVPAARPLRWVPAWCVFVVYLFVPAGFVCPFLAKLYERDGSALLVAHVAMICVGYFAVVAFAILSSMLALSRLQGGATPQRLFCLRWWGRVYMAIGLVGCLVGFVLGSIWTWERFGVVWSNDASEIGGVVMIAWTLGMLIRFSRSAAASLVDVALGIAGNPVVGMSWFVATYIKAQFAAGALGMAPTTVPWWWLGFITCWIAIHGLLLILAIVPLPRRPAEPMESSR